MENEIPKQSRYINGIEVRPTKDGVDRFRVRIRRKGQKHTGGTYRTETIAKKNKNRIQIQQEDMSAEFMPTGKQTFQDLVEHDIETILPQNPKNARNKRAHLIWWSKKLKHYRLRDLKVKKPQPARGRLRFFSLEEKDRLLAACKKSKSKDLYLIVALAISTGMRRGEILNLRWQNINFDMNSICLEETKNGEQRYVPLIGIPHELLQFKYKSQPQNSLVFPKKKNPEQPICIRKGWENALKEAQIKDCVFHSCRHTTASYLAMEHVSLIEIAALLGHKTLQTTKRYAHLSDQHMQQTALKLQSKIFNQQN